MSGNNILRIFVLLTILISACTTLEKVPFGFVSSKYIIPARTAVFACELWQNPLLGIQKSNLKNQEATCGILDKKIIAGFKDQPYMRGFTPRLMAKIHRKSGFRSSKIMDFIHKVPKKCIDCGDVASYFNRNVASQPQWLAMLTEFSTQTKNADAILLPFIVEKNEVKENIRGLHVARRHLSYELLLISTQSGKLLWHGGNYVEKRNQWLATVPAKDHKQAFPPWELVIADSFPSEVWQEYPGRK